MTCLIRLVLLQIIQDLPIIGIDLLIILIDMLGYFWAKEILLIHFVGL